jgi:metallo-beta-lactamase class B
MEKLLFLCLLLLGTTSIYAQELRIQVKKLAPQVYMHTSFGVYKGDTVPSNGLIVSTSDGVLLVDTAWGEEQTEQLAQWVEANLQQPIKRCIVTHAHNDRMSGIEMLRQRGAQVFSSELTAQLAAQQQLVAPIPALPLDTTLTLGKQQVQVYFPGAGHTSDNMVVWLPEQKILFGGCLVKDITAKSLGNTADADMVSWVTTIQNVQQKFKKAKIVVPGHGPWSDSKALSHTIDLLQQQQ